MRLRINNPLSIELSELYYEHFGTCVGRSPMQEPKVRVADTVFVECRVALDCEGDSLVGKVVPVCGFLPG